VKISHEKPFDKMEGVLPSAAHHNHQKGPAIELREVSFKDVMEFGIPMSLEEKNRVRRPGTKKD